MDEARAVMRDHLASAELVKKHKLVDQACIDANAKVNKLNGELIDLRRERERLYVEMSRKVKVYTTSEGYDVRHNTDDTVNIGCMKIPLALAKKLIKGAPKRK